MLLINILGLALIALIAWWFWLYIPGAVGVSEKGAVVTVDNGTYSPSRLKVPAGQPVSLTFLRKDASPCAATVIFPDLEISEELPLNKPMSIVLPAMQPGEYPFSCQMQMYRGTLIVA